MKHHIYIYIVFKESLERKIQAFPRIGRHMKSLKLLSPSLLGGYVLDSFCQAAKLMVLTYIMCQYGAFHLIW